MRGDWTKPNKDIMLFMRKLDRYGIPFNAIYNNKNPEGILFSELLTIQDIEKKLVKNNDLFKVLLFSNNYRIRKFITMLLDKLSLFAFYEKNRLYDKRIFISKYKNLYLDGLWQSEKYFKDNRSEILKIYNFDKIKNKKENIDFLNKINFEKSICLNVRRTDFVNNPEHNIVNMEYYKKAIQKIQNIIGNDENIRILKSFIIIRMFSFYY